MPLSLPPLSPHRVVVDLQPQLVQHLCLRILVVQVAQVYQRLPHRLVLLQDVVVLHRLAHHVAVLVLHHNHLGKEERGG